MSQLTARELELLHWTRLGKTDVEISMICGISHYTVRHHMQHVLEKMDVVNRAQAVGNYVELLMAAKRAA